MHEFGIALRDRDSHAMVAALASDVTYHSPVMSTPIVGRGVSELMEILCEILTAVDKLEEFGDDRTRVLIGAVTVGTRSGNATWVLRLDESGKVREISWQVRPFSLTVQTLNGFAGGMGSRRGRGKRILGRSGKPATLLLAAAIDRVAPLLAPPSTVPQGEK